MRVIMFQDKFAHKVRDGSKCQTIRKAARCKAGDTLSLRRWTGKPYRSKQEIIREVVCESAEPALILRPFAGATAVAAVGPEVIREDEADAFARADGFADFGEMVKWFEDTHGLPFNGWLIKWSNLWVRGATESRTSPPRCSHS